MTTETVSSSPTKTLSAWWRPFKSDESPESGSVERPPITRASASATHLRERPLSHVSGNSAVFGVPLRESLDVASVQIRLKDNNGETFVYGRIPVVIAKCGAYLKRNAKCVEGIFRIPGSLKRVKLLQELFDEPPLYGRTLTWEGFTEHDAANLFKRYLTLLPEPVVPNSFYNRFREVLEEHAGDDVGALARYEELIFELPRSSRQLLLYLVDLISVFAAESNENRMTNYNLAAIFQPSVLSTPEHEMDPEQSQTSRAVLQFLADHSLELLQHVQERAIEQHANERLADDGASDTDTSPETEPTSSPTKTTQTASTSTSTNAQPQLTSPSIPPPVITTTSVDDANANTNLEEPPRSMFQRIRSTRRANSDAEETSLFRRSLMVLLPSSPTEERPAFKRSGSWFSRESK